MNKRVIFIGYIEPIAPAQKCTCRNGHEPLDGFVYTDPNCVVHGTRTRWPNNISLSSAEISRTVGMIHNPRNMRS